ncbi:MAG: PKD domain-containing protein [Gemmataceae bacterium]
MTESTADNGRQIYARTKDGSVPTLQIDNSILGQGNTDIADIAGNATGGGKNNLIRTPLDSISGITFENTVTNDPLLGSLQDNGGGIQTHLPGDDSPVINAGDNTLAGTLTADQRFYKPRVFNSTIDIGSVEVNAVDPFPVLTAPADQTATEGIDTTINLGSLSDANESGGYVVNINWGDGNSDTIDPASLGDLSLNHTYASDNTYTVTVSASDADGDSNEITFNVVVANTPPTLTAPGNQTATEGIEATFNLGSLTDLYTSGDYTITVNWGDGTADSTFTMTAPGTLPTLAHTYATDDTYTITVSAVESDIEVDNESNEITFDVVVANTPPTLTAPVDAQTTSEGSETTFNLGSLTDLYTSGDYTVTVNWGDGTADSTLTMTAPGTLPTLAHTYVNDDTFTISVSAVESDVNVDNESNEITFDVVVNNVLPTITLVANEIGTTNLPTEINVGSFADPGVADSPWQVSIDFGDGTDPVVFDHASTGDIPVQSHTYRKAGSYTVTVKVSDDRGTTTSTSEVVVRDYLGSKIVAGGPSTLKIFNADGSFNREIMPFGVDYTGTVRVAEGDVNGDGTSDLVVSTGPGSVNRFFVIDGATQKIGPTLIPFEASFTGGTFVTTGDLNGDGAGEIIVSADNGGSTRIRVFNASNFDTVADFFGIEDSNFRGGAHAAVGDINNDGIGDLIVTAGAGGGPRVAVYEGSSVAQNAPVKLVGDFFAYDPSFRGGIFASAGDIDGDGHSDLIFSAGSGGAPHVKVISGSSLTNSNSPTLLANYFAGDSSERNGVRIAAKYLDDDNKADIVTGEGDGSGTRVLAYLGTELVANGNSNPASLLNFDAFDWIDSGVFVG